MDCDRDYRFPPKVMMMIQAKRVAKLLKDHPEDAGVADEHGNFPLALAAATRSARATNLVCGVAWVKMG